MVRPVVAPAQRETREARLGRAFVALSDTLTTDYDLIELLHTLLDTCTEVLAVAAGGLLLADPNGELQLLAATDEDVDVVELVQLSAREGPCLDCFRTGEPVSVGDIAQEAARWPDFARAARDRGFRSVHAVPMRLRREVIGTMNLLDPRVRPLDDADLAAARALADVATIGVLQARVLHASRAVAEQLQEALDSRVVIEQAKGVLAGSAGLGVDEAFRAIRAYARRTNTPIRTVAAAVVDRSLDVLRPPRSASA